MQAMLIVNAEPLLGFSFYVFQNFKDSRIQDRFPATPIELFDETVLPRSAEFGEFNSTPFSSAQ